MADTAKDRKRRRGKAASPAATGDVGGGADAAPVAVAAVPAPVPAAAPDLAPAPTPAPARISTATPADLFGPSPNVQTNLAIADIALRGSSMVARLAIEHALLGKRYAPRKAKRILKGRSIAETMLHAGLARLALTSVPGAILVGGGLLAKTLYDRSKARQAHVEGEQAMQKMAERGKEK